MRRKHLVKRNRSKIILFRGITQHRMRKTHGGKKKSMIVVVEIKIYDFFVLLFFFFFVNHACSFFFFLIMFFTWKRKIGKMLSKGCKRRVVECRSRTWTKTRRRRRRMAPKSNLFPVKNLDTRDSVCDLDRWSPRSCHPPLLWISSSVSADPCLNRKKLFHVRLIKKSFF